MCEREGQSRTERDRMSASVVARMCGLLACVLLAQACGKSAPPTDARLERIAELEDARDDSGLLVRYLIEGNEVVRARAARALGRLQDPFAVPALARVAKEDVDRAVRQEAVFALGQYGLAEQLDWRGDKSPIEATAATTVAALLGDPDIQVAALATEALGKLAPAPSVVDAEARLLEQLNSEHASVRVEAAHGLFRLRFAPLWRGQAEQPPALSDSAVEALGGALVDADPGVREAAAHALSRWGEPRAIDALVAYLESTAAGGGVAAEEWTPVFALRALGRSGESAATAPTLDAIASRLDDADLHVRLEAVTSLAALAAAERLPVQLVEDASWLVRAAAASAWARGTKPGELDALRRLEADASPGVRAAVIEALAQRLGKDAVEELDGYQSDEDYRLRAAAVRAARFLPAEEAAARLRRALRDPDVRVAVAAIEPLAGLATQVPDAEPRAWFGEVLATEDLSVRGTALTVLPQLLAQPGIELPDLPAHLTAAYDASAGLDWIEVREQLMTAAGELPPEDAAILPLLRRGLEDPAPSVVALAREALQARGETVEIAEEEGTGTATGTATETVPAEDTRSALLDVDFETAPIVVLETDKGTLRVQTLPADAPVHVANFVQLVEQGFYDGLLWHRVAPNFVIQGGDPRGDGWGGPGYNLRDEIHPVQRYRRGTLGMPKAGKDTGGGQLFFTHIPTPHLDGNYTVFGQVVEGLEVIDAIEIGDRIVRATVESPSVEDPATEDPAVEDPAVER